MSIIKVMIPQWMGTVLEGGGTELKKFEEASLAEQNAIMVETYQRAFLTSFFGPFSDWQRADVKEDKRKGKGRGGPIDYAMVDGSVLDPVMSIVSKAKTTEEVTELVRVTQTRKIGKKLVKVPVEQKKVRQKKEPKAKAELSFRYDMELSMLIVEILEVSANELEEALSFSEKLERSLKAAGKCLEERFTMDRFIKFFFDTLHIRKMCDISGTEAVDMLRIYRNAKVVYPLFAGQKRPKQIQNLDKGYHKAQDVHYGRDIHTLARSTFEVLYEQGYTDEVYMYDHVTSRKYLFTKLNERRRHRRDPDDSSLIWERNSLVFVVYNYGLNAKTYVLPVDLWELLVGKDD